MTSHVARVTLCAQRFVRARCMTEAGKELPIAASGIGHIFPNRGRQRDCVSLRMQRHRATT
ncbi:hypothetical protein BSLA_02f4723 [Burkholderia stabilis]|nr:hypothetical protein BSLA_02f4723 [Burkholderia stabilis]